MPLPLTPLATAVAVDAGIRLGTVSIKKIRDMLSAGQSIKSLADLSRPAQVEPIVMMEQSLKDQPFMTDVLKTSLTIVTGYYLQAAAMTLNVGRISTLKTLDALNPNRSMGSFRDTAKTALEPVWSAEAYEHGLPSLESMEPKAERNLICEVGGVTPSQEAQGDTSKTDISVADSENFKKFYEVENLVVGKLVSVDIQDGDHKAKLPVMIRLVPTAVPAPVMTHIFTATTRQNSWGDRYHLWRAGQIRFVRDMMFSADLIDEHRRALVNDTSNVYMAISDRRRNNIAKSSSTGQISMADASNIAIITKETARDIGRKLQGRIESLGTRKKLFDATYLMLLIVVDERWERISIYHRGIDQPTEASFRELKTSEKGKGPDITEILEAYRLGSTPTI